MPKVLWKKYKKYSGLQINGTKAVALPKKYKFNHMWRAFYLTAQLEAPKWGSVQGYDGAGISGGPFHYTAYSPGSGKQGSLFSLLRAIELGLGAKRNVNLEALWKEFRNYGWFVARDGKLRDITDGYEVAGVDIRNAISPLEGVVPKDGGYYVRAENFALLFHNLFSDPATFHAQSEHAIEYLIRGQKVIEREAYNAITDGELEVASPELLTVIINDDEIADGLQLTHEEDLAMCVYHSHSVNAPGPARTCLKQALANITSPSRDLVRMLGTSNYGRWHDTRDGKNRYDRTRQAAMQSKLWPEWLFEPQGLMPENIKE